MISFNKRHFVEKMKIAEKFIGTGNHSNVLFSKGENCIDLVACTGVGIFNTKIDYIECDNFSSALVPVDGIIKTVETFKQDEFILEFSDGSVKAKCGRNYSRFATGDVESFLIPETGNTDLSVNFTKENYHNIINNISFLVKQNQQRIYLLGINFEFNNNKCVVTGSDSYRIGQYEVLSESTINEEYKCLIGNLEFVKCGNFVNEDCTISFSDKLFEIKCGDSNYIGSLINSEYPDVNQFFPEIDFNIDVTKEDLLTSLNLIKLTLINGNEFCTFEIKDKKLKFCSLVKDVEVNYEIDIDYDGEYDITITPMMVLELINHIDKDVITFGFNKEGGRPFVLYGDKVKYLYNPVFGHKR